MHGRQLQVGNCEFSEKCSLAANSWCNTVTEDLQDIEMTWTDYGEIADDRALWTNCVVQCVSRTCGRTK